MRQNQVDQSRLPDEDAKSLVFDDTMLFEIDKFSGYDRLETGTRANVGVQYTFQANNGVYARAVFGQSYPSGRRQRRTPIRASIRAGNASTTPRSAGSQTNRSDYVAGVYLSPFAGLSLISQAASTRRTGACAARITSVTATYGPVIGTVAYTFTALRSGHRPASTRQQEIIGSPRPEADRHWSVAGIDALRHRCASSASRTSCS